MADSNTLDMGTYQIQNAGPIWDGNIKYQMIIIAKFDSDKEDATQIGEHNTCYLTGEWDNLREHIMKTNQAIEWLYGLPKYSRIEVKKARNIDSTIFTSLKKIMM